jgi:hypothetical protein
MSLTNVKGYINPFCIDFVGSAVHQRNVKTTDDLVRYILSVFVLHDASAYRPHVVSNEPVRSPGGETLLTQA